jgi:hypothetical protein
LVGIGSIVGAPQEGVLVDGTGFEGALVSVAMDGEILFRGEIAGHPPAEAGSPGRAFQVRDVVRWGNPVMARGGAIVVTANGGRLVTAAEWAGGGAVRFADEKFIMLSPLFGEVPLERGQVRGVVFAPTRGLQEREKLLERVQDAFASAGGEGNGKTEPSPVPSLKMRGNAKTDVVYLSNGDLVRGQVLGIERGSMTIGTEAGTAKLPLSRVDAVVVGGHFSVDHVPLEASRKSSAVEHEAQYSVGLRDGTLLYATTIFADEKTLQLKTGDGVSLVGGSVNDVVYLQSLNGRIRYLSDLAPVGYRHVPYLNLEWPLKRDRNALGGPLVADGKRYVKGLGMHSAGRVSYRLDGKYKRFEAAVAIDDSAEGRGSVTFAVYVVRDGKLSEAYKSDIMRGGEAPQRVSVDVAGAEGITLVVDFAERGDEMDRADWLDARVIRD